MNYNQAKEVIWAPDWHPIDEVAEAAVTVLEEPTAESLDTHQAGYLVTTYRLIPK